MAVPVPGQVDHDGAQVAERGLRLVQVPAHQPGERLLRDVLRVVRAEQPGQPDHLQVPGTEHLLDTVLVGGRHDAAPGFQIRHVPCTPVTPERLTGVKNRLVR
jgi:hypothetical protein